MRQLDLFGMEVEPKKKADEKPTAIVVQMPEKRSEPEEEFEISNSEEGTESEEIDESIPEELNPLSLVEDEEFEISNTELGTSNEEVAEDELKPLSVAEEKEETYQLKKPSIIFEIETASEAEKQTGKRGRKSFKEMDAELDLTEVPEDEVLFSKQYYSISQVAQWFKVNNSLIRYWENEFDVLKPRKNRKGDRLFRPEDVKNLQLIYHLLRQRKFTIEGAKDYLKAHKAKADVNMQLVQSLTKFKSFLLELRANLDA
jgi:DNA-binding transcriptional MerR regulator